MIGQLPMILLLCIVLQHLVLIGCTMLSIGSAVTNRSKKSSITFPSNLEMFCNMLVLRVGKRFLKLGENCCDTCKTVNVINFLVGLSLN